MHGAGHAHGRGGARAALVTARGAGRGGVGGHVARARQLAQEGALRRPALVVLRWVIAILPSHDFHLAERASHLITAA